MPRKAFIAVALLLVCLTFSSVESTLAQEVLVPNETRRTEYLFGREDTFIYEPNDYYADLESGHWTVRVDISSSMGLQVKITVAEDSSFTIIIAESGTDWGNYPTVDFTLSASDTVYIRVEENSVYGDSSGFYDIGVYDDAHLATNPLGFLGDFFFIILLSSVIIAVIIIIVVVVFILSARRSLEKISKESSYDLTRLPRRTRRILREQLPSTCPNCDGALHYGSVRWVGPHRAECPYCGHGVELKLVEVEIDNS
ncbi:MAG: hypothetical protein ACFFCO_13100 [Promethearchaeota archaeon]